MDRLRGWLALPRRERRIVLCLLLELPLVAALLRVAGYVRSRRWLEMLSERSMRRPATALELQQAHRLAELAAIAGARGAFAASCLRQSLLVYWRLRRQGFAPCLRIGVRKDAGAFDAHAWVELQGEALAQPGLMHVAFSE